MLRRLTFAKCALQLHFKFSTNKVFVFVGIQKFTQSEKKILDIAKMMYNGSGWTDVNYYAANGDVDRLRQLDESKLTKTTQVLKQTAMHIVVLKNQSQVVNFELVRAILSFNLC